jgi:gamma-glutamyltranspeptidase/glutathione hydrolase
MGFMASATRPTLRGYGGAVSAGHYLATLAGAGILQEGGNAADAACATGFALQVLEPHMNGPAGEAPILVYQARERRHYAISGQGTAPAAATIERMCALGVDLIPPDGLLAATVPAALDAWCLLLEHFGTRSLEQVLTPARGLAENGFPMYLTLRNFLVFLEERFRQEWPTSAALYLPVRDIGERQRNPALAQVLAGLVDAERAASGDREARIRTARDAFYKGRPAEQIEQFLSEKILDITGRANPGLLTAQDLATYEGSLEEPVTCSYRGAQVWKCPPWSQGPVFLQQLKLLECFDLATMQHNSVEALHTWLECAKLAFADREACYGDPRFATVPLDRLLSDRYTAQRRALVNPKRASLELRPGIGGLPEGWPLLGPPPALPQEPQALASAQGRSDTTHLDTADRFGNLVSATPSGAWIPSSPVIPELGFPIGTRAQMFVLDPSHPNALAPGKRPRTTLTPSLAELPDGRRMAFGTPGGDQQDQWSIQLFLNLIDFGMCDLQEAIDAPTVHSLHMPSSFFPRQAEPGVVAVEARIRADVVSGLETRGHRVRQGGPWDHGRVMAVTHDDDSGCCEAAASPRSETAYAVTLP